MDEDEVPLSGGNVTQVVKVGNTVRRTMQPWSATIHELLRFLERSNFIQSPRFLGIDADGREILTYMLGESGFFPYVWSETCMQSAATLLRQFHDTTASYQPPVKAQWQFVYPDSAHHEVICHNDFAPYNLVFTDQDPSALIDFDTAGPGPRIWDIAFAIYWFTPLYLHDLPFARGLDDLVQAAQRVLGFCKAYGWQYTPALFDMVEHRLDALCNNMITRAAEGSRVYQSMIDTGHLAGYQKDWNTFRACRAELERQISHEQQKNVSEVNNLSTPLS